MSRSSPAHLSVIARLCPLFAKFLTIGNARLLSPSNNLWMCRHGNFIRQNQVILQLVTILLLFFLLVWNIFRTLAADLLTKFIKKPLTELNQRKFDYSNRFVIEIADIL